MLNSWATGAMAEAHVASLRRQAETYRLLKNNQPTVKPRRRYRLIRPFRRSPG
jgi:hypothetical protein